MRDDSALTTAVLTAERWPDLETLFGRSGACSGCWCVWFRKPAAAFAADGNAGNRAHLRRLVDGGEEPGLLAYRGGRPVGWVSVGPREAFGRILRSPIVRPVLADAPQPAWSVVCFFVDRAARGSGLHAPLLAAAVDHARERGAASVEGYPWDPAARPVDAAGAYHGLVGTFTAAGFVEVARASPARPVVRRLG